MSDRITQDAPTAAEPSADEVVLPRLGPLGWARWAWRQLTSMRTALLLLLALAVAAVPGSLLPQQSADPNGVLQWRRENPGLTPLVETLQGFTVYNSVWFSAIYLLLFVSLIGCVLPRIAHHARALRKPPPRTPSRFSRLPAATTASFAGGSSLEVLDAAERLLRRRRYRVARYGASVAAERGYLRESGNLLFHLALLGLLIAVSVGGGLTSTGQRVLVTGDTFANTRSAYDSLTMGRFLDDGDLDAFTVRLDRLDVRYEQRNPNAFGQPLDFTARVTVRQQDRPAQRATIKVNQPLEIAGTKLYLLGNGYAPRITVRNADGTIAFQRAVPFRPQTSMNDSLGVVKVTATPDPARQIGMTGFLYPTAAAIRGGGYASIFPTVGPQSLVSLRVFTGNLGLDTGIPQNEYTLDPRALGLKEVATAADPVRLRIGQTVDLPSGLGTVTLDGITRFAAFDLRRDPTQGAVAASVAAAVLGLIGALLIPRRRIWVRTTQQDDLVLVEYGALARGQDASLQRVLDEFAAAHRTALPRSPAGG